MMMHLSVRSRYRLVLICTALLLFRFFLPYGGHHNSIESDITDSINSILRLSARICKTGGSSNGHGKSGLQKPISLKDGLRSSLDYQGPPVPLSQIDRTSNNGNSNNNRNKNKKIADKKKPVAARPQSGKQHEHYQDPNHQEPPQVRLHKTDVKWGSEDAVPPKPASKPPPEKRPAIADPFPLLSKNNLSPFYQNLLKERTAPPHPHPPEDTPLFIGFTRNWPQLLQCVVSYIAAGWPADDIYVVENTGVMYSNRRGELSLQNPFFLNHTQLNRLGVRVLVTPTLLTFSQLQNFYAWTALEHDWTEYFWSHQDVVVFSFEEEDEFDMTDEPKKQKDKKVAGNNIYDRNSSNSLYHRAVSVQQTLRQNGQKLASSDNDNDSKWANVFFAYDQLTLVNTAAVVGVGGWDTQIPFYTSDCDMYTRQTWAGYAHYETASPAGIILDVASVLDDLGALLRIPGIHATFSGDPGPPLTEQPWWKAINSVSPGSSSDKPQENDEQSDIDPYNSPTSTTLSPQEAFLHEMNILTRLTKQTDRYGETFSSLVATVKRMNAAKYAGNTNGHRNTWQKAQSGGQGEPFYRDPEGFEQAVWMAVDLGRAVFAEKWGHRGCDIGRVRDVGNADAWRLERDWDVEVEGWGYEGDGW